MKKPKIKRIPTILALLVLLMGLAVGLVLINKATNLLLRAEPEITPKQAKITNVTENSFSVSWITDGKTSGFIRYGNDKNLSLTAVDDRDQISGKTGSFSTHHTTIRDLRPATTYFFKITSNGKTFDNNGQEYQLITAPITRSPIPANDVAYGTIINSDNSPAEGVIVYLSLANTTSLSVLSKSSGNWVIPLNLARSADLSTYATYDREASIEEIFIQGGLAGTATAVATTKYDSPLPNIILGQSFDFRKPPSEKSDTQSTQSQGRFSSSEGNGQSSSSNSIQVSIINPRQGEQVNTQKPEIIGTGPAGETLTITVNSSEPLTGSITIDNDGSWSWTPSSNLAPGEHTVSARLLNGRTITRSFIVLAAGTNDSPSFTASPSATLTPTATPTAIPTAIPTTSLTSTPTATPTLSSRTTAPSTEAGVPQPGSLTPTLFLFIMGTALISLGSIFIIWLKRSIINA